MKNNIKYAYTDKHILYYFSLPSIKVLPGAERKLGNIL